MVQDLEDSIGEDILEYVHADQRVTGYRQIFYTADVPSFFDKSRDAGLLWNSLAVFHVDNKYLKVRMLHRGDRSTANSVFDTFYAELFGKVISKGENAVDAGEPPPSGIENSDPGSE